MCTLHYNRWRRHGDPHHKANLQGAGASERFWAKVDKSGGEDACWLWTASLTDQGYGSFWLSKDQDKYRAHRFSYEEWEGEIPDGLVLDHTCHNDTECSSDSSCSHRRCVNPKHLEAVTQKVNSLRGNSLPSQNAKKTHCPRGHEYSEENTRIHNGTGYRQCKTCHTLVRKIKARERSGQADLPLDVRLVKTHCKRGHEFSEENTGLSNSKSRGIERYCKKCRELRKEGLL